MRRNKKWIEKDGQGSKTLKERGVFWAVLVDQGKERKGIEKGKLRMGKQEARSVYPRPKRRGNYVLSVMVYLEMRADRGPMRK